MKNYINKTSKLMSCGAMIACFVVQSCGYSEVISYGDTPSKPEETPNYPAVPGHNNPEGSGRAIRNSHATNRESEEFRESKQAEITANGTKTNLKVEEEHSPSRISTTSNRGSTTVKKKSSGGFFGCFGNDKKASSKELEKTEGTCPPNTNTGPKVEERTT